jgi:hypothetical protein
MVHDFGFLDREGMEIDLFDALDPSGVHKTAKLGLRLPAEFLLARATTTTRTTRSAAAAATTTTTITTSITSSTTADSSTALFARLLSASLRH